MEQITKTNCAEAINRICEESRITKKQLAEFLGVAPSSITQIIKGDQKVSDHIINKMKALQVLGYAKYKDLLSSKGKIDPALLSGKDLTVSGVLTGLTAMVSLKTVGTVAAISIPLLGLGPAIAGGLLAGGIFTSLTKICKKNKLRLSEKNGSLEIEPNLKKENHNEKMA